MNEQLRTITVGALEAVILGAAAISCALATYAAVGRESAAEHAQTPVIRYDNKEHESEDILLALATGAVFTVRGIGLVRKKSGR